ncbi:MAG: NADPH-dependent oxidoreductase, partial [Acetanaerobacterium sp.]
DKTKSKCEKLAKKFHDDVASTKLYPPSLLTLIPYNLFRGMSLSYIKGTDYEYMDGTHWTDPIRAKRVYDPSVPVPFYKRPFGNLFYLIGKIATKFFVITYRK